MEVIGEMKQGLLMPRGIGESQFGLLAFRNIFNHTDKVIETFIRIANRANGLIDPDWRAVFADQALFGGVLIEFACDNFAGLDEIGFEILPDRRSGSS